MIAEDSVKRSEKLAFARKKLKQYQQTKSGSGSKKHSPNSKENRRPLSEGYRGYSTDSLAESTVSENRHIIPNNSFFEKRRSIDFSPPSDNGGGFRHDEHRSPFQRVRGGSDSSESSSAFAASSSRGRTPLEPRTSLEEEEEEPDDDGPALETVVVGNSSGVPNLASYFENDSNGAASVNMVESFEKKMEEPLDSGQEEKNCDAENQAVENMVPKDVENSCSRDIVISPADNESKQEAGAVVILTDHSCDNSVLRLHSTTPVSAPSVSVDSIEIGGSGSSDSDLLAMNEQLQKALEESQRNYLQLANQYQQLNGHYAQLHAAYTLSQQQNGQLEKSDQQFNELRKDVQKHMQTITVLVEEKSDLQSQLRQAVEIANQKHAENQELQGRLNQNREKLSELEKDNEQNCSNRTSLEQTLQKQKRELERSRHESAQWEAKVIEMQQDKSESHARLKMKSRELDRLHAELGDLRKEIQMKEIYIRQLTAAGAQPHIQQEMEETIGQLREENEKGKQEILEAHAVVEQWRKQAEQSREQYEIYGRQLNQKILELSAQVEKLSEEKHEGEAKRSLLEDELSAVKEMLVQNGQGRTESELAGDEVEKARDHLDTVEVQQQIQKALEEAASLNEQKELLQIRLNERDGQLEDLTEKFRVANLRIERLEEEINEQSQCSTDTQNLLEQLQSEKTTVSRAVAQNRELKEQLQELQDKFVKMTEDTMESESRFRSAEFSAQQFQEQLRKTEEELNQRKRDYFNLEERLNLVMKESVEKSQLEEKLREEISHKTANEFDLEDFRMQVEALKQQNASLTEKCNLLNAASHDTVADVFTEQHNNQVAKLETDLEELRSKVEENANLESEVARLEREVVALRQDSQRLANENDELHRIMQQNAEDENQNTIHVELQQALNRITALSGENEVVRRRLEESRRLLVEAQQVQSEQRMENGVNCGKGEDENSNSRNDDESSICSDHIEQRRDAVGGDAYEKLKTAMDMLQSRFTKAMEQNADLSDQNQYLEHLIIQLQGETDTIGEYITIYQHQRKGMRDKIKEKEAYLAKLSREKEGMQRKLKEVQNLVMRLLNERGAMQAYHQNPPTREKPSRASSPSRPSNREKTLSLSEVDELSGTEQAIFSSVDGFSAVMNTSHTSGDAEAGASGVEDGRISPAGSEDSGTAEQILRLLTEMRKPELVENLPPIDRNLHCKYCTGKLLVL